MTRAFSSLLLTEDSSEHAVDVLKEIVTRVLRLVEAQVDLRGAWCDPPTPEGRRAMVALSFKARSQRRARVDLIREILERLQDEHGFVAVHMDGDIPWGESELGTKSPRLMEFRKHILPGVQEGVGELAPDNSISRLLFVRPYYSVEAWLFQNTACLKRIYARHHPGHPDLRRIDAWEQAPNLLDELPKPKENLVIRDKFNLELAESLPGRKLDPLGRSFHFTVRSFRENNALRSCLRAACFAQAPATAPAKDDS